MKKFLTVMGAITLLTACNKEAGYTINGETNGLADGTKVYIEKIDASTGETIAIDSTEVTNNAFTLKGIANNLDQSFLAFGSDGSKLPFILENGVIAVKYDSGNSDNNTAIGTKNNDEYNAFFNKLNELGQEIQKYQEDNQQAIKEASEANDTEKRQAIIDGYMALAEGYGDFTEEYVNSNPKSFTTLVYLTQSISTGQYLKEELVAKYDNFDEALKESTVGKTLKTALDNIPDAKVKLGDVAPDFAAPSPDGTEISLKESLGKVTIIDFWASWCGPCRVENPNVVALYNEYHPKGLNIIGVSLDKDKDKWIEAIAHDKLAWNQISNLEFWQDPIAKEYEVRAIPATYILDENGVVIAKNLRGKKLKAKIQEILDK